MKRPSNHHILDSCLSDFLRPGMAAWNIGSSHGYFALRMGQLVGSNGTVHAFEPSSKHYHALKCKITAYGLEHVIVPDQLALLRSNGTLDRTSNDSSHSTHFAVKRKSGNGAAHQFISWKVDDLVLEHGYAAPDLLKIDLQGSETEAVAGMERILNMHRPTLVIAVREESARLIANLLSPHHYFMRHIADESAAEKDGTKHLIFEPEAQVAGCTA